MRPLIPALAFLLALGLACDSPTEPTAPDAFIAVVRRQDPAPLTAFAAGTSPGIVSVAGNIATPDPCYGFAASTRREARTLTVTLHARPNSSGCLAPLTEWNYQITVPDVPTGEWRIVVRHSYAHGSIAEPVLDTAVVVPN